MPRTPVPRAAQRRAAGAVLRDYGIGNAWLTRLKGLSGGVIFRVEVPRGDARPDDRYVLGRLEQQLRRQLAAVPLDQDHAGVIHGDLHPLNLLFRGQEVRAIDFDGATYDYFANDLAVSLGEGVAGSPLMWSFEGKRRALVRGYARLRTPPADDVLDALLTLKRVRSIPGLIRWTHHEREGIAHWASEQLRDRLRVLRQLPK